MAGAADGRLAALDGSQTICWCCENATNSKACPWADRAEPVPGWVADDHFIKLHSGSRVYRSHSFIVKECPLFKRDAFWGGSEKMWGAKSAADTEYADLTEIAAAIIIQAVYDWQDLECGKLDKLARYKKDTLYKDELLRFFFSGYFESLCHHVTKAYEPWEFRAALHIREEDRPREQ